MTIYNTPRKNAPPGNMVIVRFCVEADELQPGDSIQVVGSCEDLGLWDPAHALMLTPDQENPKRWTGFIETSEETIKFRYFISYMLTGDEGDRMVISLWESFLLPRCVLTRVEQKDGECRNSQTDLFGFYAGRRLVSEGWLQHEEENQILLRVHGNSLKYYKKGQTGAGRLRVTPLDVRRRTAFSGTVDDDEHEEEDIEHYNYDSHSSTTVGNLSSSTPQFASQPADGCMFLNGSDYLVFKTHSVAVEHLAFYIEVIDADGKKASCYALPSSLNDTFGLTSLPFITKSGRPVGQLSVEYLFVRSLHRPHPRQTMETSFSRHWKKRTTLEVGHRGMGNSYTKFAAARENTIHSLNSAAENGADFVEFDVQLTKDKVAVIYHDFHVLVSVAKRVPEMVDLSLLDDHADSSLNYHEMAVKDLKLKQCKLLMLDHCAVSRPKSDVEVKKLVGDSCEADDLKPFPTLLEALNKVNSDVGFNVEVKYPMMQNDGIHECSNYFERNEFVDIILADVLNNAGGRRIMFSSFDPDICSLIAMKQNRYPVLFLCIGETERYTPFKDQRSSTSLTAVHFAAGAGILGVNFHSEDLLKDARPVKKATDFGLVSFVWGDDLNHRENIPYFKKELCVDGIIYDRIGEEERRQNVFLVEREQKRALFLVNSGANTPVRPGSPQLPPSPPRSASKEAPDSPPSGPPSPIRRVASLAHDMPRVQITQS